MTFYLVLLSSLMGIGFLYNFILPKYSDEIYLISTFVILSLVSSIRFGVGYDYLYIYVDAFNEVNNLTFNEIISSYLGSEQTFTFVGRHEIGYVLIEYITSLFSSDFRVIFAVTSIIIIGLVSILFYKYAHNKMLAVFLFFCFGMFYSSLNFVRQNISAIIVTFAFLQIKEKNFLKFTFLIILAGLFHKGAFFMFPFYFILQIKMTKVVLFLYSLVTGFILLFSNSILGFAVENFFPWYSSSLNSAFIVNGIPFYYLIVPTFMFFLLFKFRGLFANDREYIFINIAFFNVFFFVLGSKHFVIERFTLFFQYANIIAITILFDKIRDYNYYNLTFTKNDFKSIASSILPYLLIIFFSLGLNYLFLTVDGHSVVPYSTIFGDLYELYLL